MTAVATHLTTRAVRDVEPDRLLLEALTTGRFTPQTTRAATIARGNGRGAPRLTLDLMPDWSPIRGERPAGRSSAAPSFLPWRGPQ